jgi:hypothetical protein
MLKEAKIFLETLTHFRQLLNEGVGEGTVVDAIKKHKIVHIYYAGDDTILKGYRTIKPYVLGHTKSKKAQKNGEDYMLLRAWETAGNSDSKKIYYNEKNKPQYGWRLFRVDKITSFLPTGEHFSTEDSKFPDVEGYNPNDSQMQNIVAAVEIESDKPRTTVRGAVVKQKLPPSSVDAKGNKFKRYSNAAKKQRDITADEVEHLWGMVNQMRARGNRDKYFVVQTENGDMVAKTENQLKNIDPDSVVGNLRDLYIKLVKPSEKVTDTSFIEKAKRDALKEANKMNKTNIPIQNTEKRTFFK